MENKKRPLKPYEKIMHAFAILLIISAFPWLILQFADQFEYALSIAWMCLSLANILTNCIRWETRTKENVVSLWLWSAMFVFSAVMLILRLVL